MSNLTRIKNNQIVNSTIIASQKIAAGTITGSLFSSNVTVPGDLLISGNLFVLGTSAYTTIASTNTYVNDPLVVLNNGFAGTNTYDEGVVFNRGSLLNQAFIWNEFNKEFRLIGTTETGTTYGNVAVSNFANLHIGNLTVDYSITHTGDFFTNGFINTTGNISAATGLFGAINSTGLINTTGNLSASQVSVATINATGFINTAGNVSAAIGLFGAINSTGLINTTGNLSASTINAATVNTSGNVLAAVFNGGALNVSGNVAASTVLAQLVTADDATFGNVVAGFVGNTGTEFTGASINLSGNVSASTVLAQLVTADDATVGNLAAGFVGNAGTVYTGATINLSGNVLGGLAQFSAINSTPIGNATPSTGTFTTITAGAVSSGFIGNTGTEFTGASLNVSGNILANNIITSTITAATLATPGNVIGGLAQFAAINSTPIGNATASTGAFTTLSASQNFYANASIATTAQGIGAVVVPNGGISVAGAANVAGALTIGGATQLNSTLGVGGITTFTNSTNATAITNGAVIIQGGASVLKDLYVGGNLYAANIVGVSANVITVEDPLLFLKPSYTFPYNYDIGVYSSFTGTGLTTAGNVLQHTAIVRHQETNTWTFASNLAEPGAGHVVFDNNTVYDPIKAGNLTLVNTTASTTTGTGALIVAGGAGIAGAVTAGSFNTAGNVLASDISGASLNVSGNVSATELNTGTIKATGLINTLGNVSASVVIAGQFNTTGNLSASEVSTATLNATGLINTLGNVSASVVIAGQFNTTGNLVASQVSTATLNATGLINTLGNISASRINADTLAATGTIWANSSTASTNTSTGALVLAGGLGLAGNIFQGGAYLDTSSSNYILAGTPTTVDAFKNATTLNLGATSGTATIGNPTVVGTQTTQALYNTVATTLNAFGAATTLNLGATSGTATIGNPTVVGTQTTQALYNTTATTLNFAGAATALVAGATTGLASIRNAVINFPNATSYVTDQTDINVLNANVLSANVLGSANSITIGSTLGFTTVRHNLEAQGILFAENIAEATSEGSGGLVAFGGAGITGNLFVGNSAVFNNKRSTGTFQIKSSTSGNVAFFANLSGGPTTTESVIIGGGNTIVQAGVTLKISSQTTMMMPVGPTSARPSSLFGAGYDVAGMMRFNSTINNLEFYDGTQWQVTGSAFTVISDRQFSGNTAGGFGNVDGTNTVFTIQSNATTSGSIVSINGVMQFPTLAYSVSGDQLTFTEPPAPGDVIDVRILTTTTTVGALTNGNGANQFVADDDGSSIFTGPGGGSVERIFVDIGGNINVLAGSKITYDQTPTQVVNTNLTLLDRFSANAYTTAKYVISMKQGTGNVQAMEALLTQSTVGTTAGTAYVTTYGIVNTGNTMGTLAANVDVSGGWVVNMWLIPNAATAISNVKVMTTYIV
jgi:hypothetical protein